MKIRYSGISLRSVAIVTAAIVLMTIGFWMLSQSSPAVVKAQTGLGGPLPNLTPLETTMFNSGASIFARRWDAVHGLGPVFTQVSCSLCHLSPVIGGASTTKNTFFGKINQDGSFNPLTEEGGMFLQPFSIQRFVPGCVLRGEVVPVDATVHAKHLTPEVFGMGLIDSIPDQTIRDYAAVVKGLGIIGIVDEVTDEKNNPRVGKYGYKAQFATVMQITASAMVHDIGITTPLEPIEDKPQGVDPPPACLVAPEPNDPDGANLLSTFHFVMYLAPNPPGQPPNTNGQTQFNNAGCSICHLPTYTTGPDIIMPVDTKGRTIHSKALSSQLVNLYSDLLLHDMGSGLSDGLPLTPSATATMFRTTPLWGLSTRIANGFGLLHDGRTVFLDKSLQVDKAIRAHGGEAAQSLGLYKGLAPLDQQDLIAFVSSL
jgi:CxxC motif-containing protein (DUF1111 family)